MLFMSLPPSRAPGSRGKRGCGDGKHRTLLNRKIRNRIYKTGTANKNGKRKGGKEDTCLFFPLSLHPVPKTIAEKVQGEKVSRSTKSGKHKHPVRCPGEERSHGFSLFRLRFSFSLLLVILTLAGMGLRLLFSMEVIASDPFASSPPAETDMATYFKLAKEILAGNLPETFFYQPFYSAVFLPFFAIFVPSLPWAAALGQTLCAGGVIWFAGLSAALLKGRRAGLTAAFLAAFSTMLVFYVPYALIEIQQCFWITLLFYLTLRGMREMRKMRSSGAEEGKGIVCHSLFFWIAAGMVLGASILSRGSSWCFAPLMFLAALYGGSFRLRGWLYGGLTLLASVLVQLPFILWNSLALGRFSGPSTAGPTVLGLGNNPEAPPGYLVYTDLYKDWMAYQSETAIVHRIADWAFSEPLAFLELYFRKFLLFWDSLEIPNNLVLGVNASKSDWFDAAFIPTWLIVILALASFLLLLSRLPGKKGILLLTLFIVLYAGAAAAFYILARFRVPCLGLLCIAASLWVACLLSDLRKRRIRRILLFNTGALLGGIFLTLLAYDYYRVFLEPSVMRAARPYGVRAEFSGGRRVYDNGPLMLGGWRMFPVRSGLLLTKKFHEKASGAFADAEKPLFLEIHFFSYRYNEFTVTVNGVSHRVTLVPKAPAPYEDVVRIPLRPLKRAGGEVNEIGGEETMYRISFSNVANDEATALAMDFQRDYGRSSLDGEVMPGEFVISLSDLPEGPSPFSSGGR